jgi:glycosyltransferase involved in cell wall biosynthesis
MDRFSEGMDKVRVIHHRRNYGQGRALRSGFAASRGAVVVTLDADLSYGPENIWNLVDALQKENVEIALASPYMKGGTVRNVPFHRKILSRLGNFYLARMSHYKISTSTCVVRAYRREVLDGMFLASDGMELQLEILMKASIAGFRVCEVPAGLEWADEKAAGAGFRRASKMKILRAIRLYLLLGWLSRPAYFFIILSLLLFLPGAYMAFALAYRLACAVGRHLGEGLSAAVSSGMAEVFTSYAYSVVFCGAFLLMGLQGFAFTLLLLQNKFYFEELYRQSQTRTGSGTSFRI